MMSLYSLLPTKITWFQPDAPKRVGHQHSMIPIRLWVGTELLQPAQRGWVGGKSLSRGENILALAGRAVKLGSPRGGGVRRARELGSAGDISDSWKRARERTGTIDSEEGRYSLSQVVPGCQRKT